MKRVMIAGTGSGCGKTTVTCAILAAMQARGIRTASFKCGPDYIDPMFHREILGAESYNLDSYFCDRDKLCYLLDRGSRQAEFTVIEGVMGFYDGGSASAYAISELTETPVIAVINCKGMSDSIGAVMQGFLQYRKPNRIIGFIFNLLPEKLIPMVKHLCCDLGTAFFGAIPKHNVPIESRHLGLITASEIECLQQNMQTLGALAEQCGMPELLLELPDSPVPAYQAPVIPKFEHAPAIAVAKDRAFCFQYPENIALLREMGCEIRFFSPIADSELPESDGLILCGGYPELYAAELSANAAMRMQIQAKIRNGMPVIAECGGFLYLHRSLQTKDGSSYPMADVIPADAFPCDRLQRFGYVEMHADADNLLCENGRAFKAHSFHYWDSTDRGNALTAVKQNGTQWKTGYLNETMYAAFPHLYFYADPEIAARFVRRCIQYGESK